MGCGKRGHIKKDCNARKKARKKNGGEGGSGNSDVNSSSAYLRVFVDSVEVTALVDTGAAVTACSPELRQVLGREPEAGETEGLRIESATTTFGGHFHVALLLRARGVTLDLKVGAMRFRTGASGGPH